MALNEQAMINGRCCASNKYQMQLIPADFNACRGHEIIFQSSFLLFLLKLPWKGYPAKYGDMVIGLVVINWDTLNSD